MSDPQQISQALLSEDNWLNLVSDGSAGFLENQQVAGPRGPEFETSVTF